MRYSLTFRNGILNGIEPYYYIRDILNKCPLIVVADDEGKFSAGTYINAGAAFMKHLRFTQKHNASLSI